ncbi:MAG: AAA family ATPase [Candidatus Bathyarchaeia archaeon]
MPVWNLVLSGYPGSGKTVLARRLVTDNSNFIRLSVDDIRLMYFGSTEPSEDEEFVYNCLASLRDLALRSGYSSILDCTAPTNTTREFLLNTKVENAIRLLVQMVVDKKELERRNQERGIAGAVDAWDRSWQPPATNMPVMKFRNDDKNSFETNYYLLTELLRSKVNPYRRRFLGNIFPRI